MRYYLRACSYYAYCYRDIFVAAHAAALLWLWGMMMYGMHIPQLTSRLTFVLAQCVGNVAVRTNITYSTYMLKVYIQC